MRLPYFDPWKTTQTKAKIAARDVLRIPNKKMENPLEKFEFDIMSD